jgi:hypothetical protein
MLNDTKIKIAKDMQEAICSLEVNKKRPLGKFNPWAWWIEITERL